MDYIEAGKDLLKSASHVLIRGVKHAVHQPIILWSVEDSLPVAGISSTSAQGILFSIEQSETTPEDESVSVHWIQTLQVAQITVDRLLKDIKHVERNLNFWDSQLMSGSHFRFMLLGRGPHAFIMDVAAALHLREADELNATDKMQQRVLMLRSMRTILYEALAEVYAAAGALSLVQQSANEPSSQQAQHRTSSWSTAQPKQTELLQAAIQAASTCISTINSVLRRVEEQVAILAKGQSKEHLRQAAAAQTLTGSTSGKERAASAMVALVPSPDRPSLPEGQGTADITALLQQAQELLHVQLPPFRPKHDTASQALQQARHAAARPGRAHVARIPHWARMPNALERHWLRFGALACAATWALRFLYRHSSLNGSDDLNRWIRQATSAVQDAWQEHVVEPLLNVRNELFKTFRDRPNIVSPREFEADKQTLLRMLEDFQRDCSKTITAAQAAQPSSKQSSSAAPTAASPTPHGSSSSPQGGPSSSTPPSATSSSTTAALAPPGSASGNSRSSGSSSATQLAAGNTGAAGAAAGGTSTSSGGSGSSSSGAGSSGMSEADQDALVSGMQAVMASYEAELRAPLKNLLVGDLARAMLIQVQRLKLDTEAAMLELDQILHANELSISLVAAIPSLVVTWGLLMAVYRWLRPRAPDVKKEAVPLRMAAAELERALARLQLEGATAEAEGYIVYRIYRVYSEAQHLYRQHDRTTRYSEWPQLEIDLLQLAQLIPAKQRLMVHERMMRTYRVFQH